LPREKEPRDFRRRLTGGSNRSFERPPRGGLSVREANGLRGACRFKRFINDFSQRMIIPVQSIVIYEKKTLKGFARPISRLRRAARERPARRP
jgi:hypothetical protein